MQITEHVFDVKGAFGVNIEEFETVVAMLKLV